MERELIFRTIFIAYFIAVVALRCLAKRQTNNPEPENRNSENNIETALCAINLFWKIGAVLYMLNFSWLRWFSMALPEWLRWSGAVFGIISVMLLFWAHKALNQHFSSRLELLDNHELVTNGPYRTVRHPMYSAIIIAFVSGGLITASLMIIIPGALAIYFLYLRIDVEEKMLIERFGNEYLLYKARTGKLLPRIFVNATLK